jgi:predicted dehydrogenase
MTSFGGHAWSAPLPESVIWLARDPALLRHAPVALQEDGAELGPAQAPLEVIRQAGGGAYQLSDDLLIFSTSDNSDPRSNRRTYAFDLAEGLLEASRVLRSDFQEGEEAFDMGWAAEPGDVRVAVIGAGRRGVRLARLIKRWPAFRLALLVDPLAHRTAFLKSRLKLPQLQTAEVLTRRLLRENGISIAFIASPDAAHAESAIEAMRVGCHVFIEKPIASTVRDARRIAAESRRLDRLAHVGFVLRYAPFWRAIKRELTAGGLGSLQFVSISDQLSLMHGASYMRRWHSDPATGGLILHKGCHDLDLLSWLLGAVPVRVASFGARAFFARRPPPSTHCSRCPERDACAFAYEHMPLGTTPEERADPARFDLDRCVFGVADGCAETQTAMLEFPGGLIASYELLMFGASVSDRKVQIVGSHGTLVGSFSAGRLRIDYNDGRPAQIISTATGEGHGGGDERSVATFLRAVRGLPSETLPPEEAGVSVAVAFAAERARLAGRAIPVVAP